MTTILQIGLMIASARTAKRISKTQVALQAGISRNTLQQLEVGLGNVELKTLLALCEVLGLDIVLAPKEVSAKMQTPFPRLTSPADVGASRADTQGKSLTSRKPTNFLGRMIQNKERLASSNLHKTIGPNGPNSDDAKKDEK